MMTWFNKTRRDGGASAGGETRQARRAFRPEGDGLESREVLSFFLPGATSVSFAPGMTASAQAGLRTMATGPNAFSVFGVNNSVFGVNNRTATAITTTNNPALFSTTTLIRPGTPSTGVNLNNFNSFSNFGNFNNFNNFANRVFSTPVTTTLVSTATTAPTTVPTSATASLHATPLSTIVTIPHLGGFTSSPGYLGGFTASPQHLGGFTGNIPRLGGFNPNVSTVIPVTTKAAPTTTFASDGASLNILNSGTFIPAGISTVSPSLNMTTNANSTGGSANVVNAGLGTGFFSSGTGFGFF